MKFETICCVGTSLPLSIISSFPLVRCMSYACAGCSTISSVLYGHFCVCVWCWRTKGNVPDEVKSLLKSTEKVKFITNSWKSRNYATYWLWTPFSWPYLCVCVRTIVQCHLNILRYFNIQRRNLFNRQANWVVSLRNPTKRLWNKRET